MNYREIIKHRYGNLNGKSYQRRLLIYKEIKELVKHMTPGQYEVEIQKITKVLGI